MLAFSFAWDYTLFVQSDKGFAPQNQIFDSSGQGEIPYRRYSPRADAIRQMHDSVRFRGRQYSLDERRMRGTSFRLFTVLKCRIGVSDFLFSWCCFSVPKILSLGRFFMAAARLRSKHENGDMCSHFHGFASKSYFMHAAARFFSKQ